MIKAVKDNVVFIGLSDKNLELLRVDRPIKFNLKELGLADIDIVIFNGKDEQAMKKTMIDANLIHPTKTIIKDDNAPNN